MEFVSSMGARLVLELEIQESISLLLEQMAARKESI